MAIELRSIPNNDLVTRAEEIAGLQVNTDFTDTQGRLVSGRVVSAKTPDNGMIAVTLDRYLDDCFVSDSAVVPAGTDPLGHP
jgi:hypothetical protein